MMTAGPFGPAVIGAIFRIRPGMQKTHSTSM